MEIDKPKLVEKLLSLGASDLGEELITQQMFHDPEGKWYSERKFVRIRRTGGKTLVAYKHVQTKDAVGTVEIEFEITEPEKMKVFLEALGLVMDRMDEKRRHKFKLGQVIVDIDTWPGIPTYVELEGPNEQSIQDLAGRLGFDYGKGVFGTVETVLKEVYQVDLSKIRRFTFDKAQ